MGVSPSLRRPCTFEGPTIVSCPRIAPDRASRGPPQTGGAEPEHDARWRGTRIDGRNSATEQVFATPSHREEPPPVAQWPVAFQLVVRVERGPASCARDWDRDRATRWWRHADPGTQSDPIRNHASLRWASPRRADDADALCGVAASHWRLDRLSRHHALLASERLSPQIRQRVPTWT